ncbi:alanine racemase [Candidatus Bipolaricaulota bacterium]|nr:alanine racemase [Candidatus Bipolaricaulota bacterium]
MSEIYLARLRENIELVLEHVPPGVQVMGVVKADGYGHGAAQIARVLAECGISYLAVSDVDEALALRDGTRLRSGRTEKATGASQYHCGGNLQSPQHHLSRRSRKRSL